MSGAVVFQRLGLPGREIPVVRGEDGIARDLRSLTSDIDGEFLVAGGLCEARRKLRTLVPLEGAEAMRVGAPIARPTAVVCIGQNYAAHAAESGDPIPTLPIVFFKHPNTVVGPFDDVEAPMGAASLDWEVELGVVIGKRAHRLEEDADALAYVAGYVVSHDVSERNWQIHQSGGQWSKGKSSPTFNPLGPWLVPADQVDPWSLRLWSRVNDEPRQDSSTADMVFDVPTLVRHLSQFMALEPGDLINTGTPQGVGLSGRFAYLRDSDVVTLGIQGLGEQRQRVTTR
ncbi:MAG: fumarylacetoacetate hydrolase family protein [Microbacterium sp.]